MPNRILREGILTSDRINALDAGAEVFYRRLMSVVDDYGRFDARPIMLKVTCYPLRVDKVREADISRWMAICQKAGLLALYAVNGKQYLELVDFNQQVRAKHSKYPCKADATHPHSTCLADAHLDGGVVGDDKPMSSPTDVGSDPSLSTRAQEKPKVNGSHQGTRLPDDWRLPEDWKTWALAVRQDWTPQQAVSASIGFRDYWIAIPGADGRKANWLATWRRWVRTETHV